MASNERIRKYLDAGSVLGQVSRGRAEEIVRELANAGDIQRSQAQEWVDGLMERSRKNTEQVLDAVRHEVAAQLNRIDGKALEHLANQVAAVLKKSAEAGRKTTKGVTTQAGRTATAARTRAGSTATAARTRAGSTATAARRQVGKTAGQARAVAGRAVPTRRRAPKAAPKKGPAKATAKKSREAGSAPETAKKAAKKAAS